MAALLDTPSGVVSDEVAHLATGTSSASLNYVLELLVAAQREIVDTQRELLLHVHDASTGEGGNTGNPAAEWTSLVQKYQENSLGLLNAAAKGLVDAVMRWRPSMIVAAQDEASRHVSISGIGMVVKEGEVATTGGATLVATLTEVEELEKRATEQERHKNVFRFLFKCWLQRSRQLSLAVAREDDEKKLHTAQMEQLAVEIQRRSQVVVLRQWNVQARATSNMFALLHRRLAARYLNTWLRWLNQRTVAKASAGVIQAQVQRSRQESTVSAFFSAWHRYYCNTKVKRMSDDLKRREEEIGERSAAHQADVLALQRILESERAQHAEAAQRSALQLGALQSDLERSALVITELTEQLEHVRATESHLVAKHQSVCEAMKDAFSQRVHALERELESVAHVSRLENEVCRRRAADVFNTAHSVLLSATDATDTSFTLKIGVFAEAFKELLRDATQPPQLPAATVISVPLLATVNRSSLASDSSSSSSSSSTNSSEHRESFVERNELTLKVSQLTQEVELLRHLTSSMRVRGSPSRASSWTGDQLDDVTGGRSPKKQERTVSLLPRDPTYRLQLGVALQRYHWLQMIANCFRKWSLHVSFAKQRVRLATFEQEKRSLIQSCVEERDRALVALDEHIEDEHMRVMQATLNESRSSVSRLALTNGSPSPLRMALLSNTSFDGGIEDTLLHAAATTLGSPSPPGHGQFGGHGRRWSVTHRSPMAVHRSTVTATGISVWEAAQAANLATPQMLAQGANATVETGTSTSPSLVHQTVVPSVHSETSQTDEPEEVLPCKREGCHRRSLELEEAHEALSACIARDARQQEEMEILRTEREHQMATATRLQTENEHQCEVIAHLQSEVGQLQARASETLASLHTTEGCLVLLTESEQRAATFANEARVRLWLQQKWWSEWGDIHQWNLSRWERRLARYQNALVHTRQHATLALATSTNRTLVQQYFASWLQLLVARRSARMLVSETNQLRKTLQQQLQGRLADVQLAEDRRIAAVEAELHDTQATLVSTRDEREVLRRELIRAQQDHAADGLLLHQTRSVVVEYCASSAFFRWMAVVHERKHRRRVRLDQTSLEKVARWYHTAHSASERVIIAQWGAFHAATMGVHQSVLGAVVEECKALGAKLEDSMQATELVRMEIREIWKPRARAAEDASSSHAASVAFLEGRLADVSQQLNDNNVRHDRELEQLRQDHRQYCEELLESESMHRRELTVNMDEWRASVNDRQLEFFATEALQQLQDLHESAMMGLLGLTNASTIGVHIGHATIASTQASTFALGAKMAASLEANMVTAHATIGHLLCECHETLCSSSVDELQRWHAASDRGTCISALQWACSSGAWKLCVEEREEMTDILHDHVAHGLGSHIKELVDFSVFLEDQITSKQQMIEASVMREQQALQNIATLQSETGVLRSSLEEAQREGQRWMRQCSAMEDASRLERESADDQIRDLKLSLIEREVLLGDTVAQLEDTRSRLAHVQQSSSDRIEQLAHQMVQRRVGELESLEISHRTTLQLLQASQRQEMEWFQTFTKTKLREEVAAEIEASLLPQKEAHVLQLQTLMAQKLDERERAHDLDIQRVRQECQLRLQENIRSVQTAYEGETRLTWQREAAATVRASMLLDQLQLLTMCEEHNRGTILALEGQLRGDAHMVLRHLTVSSRRMIAKSKHQATQYQQLLLQSLTAERERCLRSSAFATWLRWSFLAAFRVDYQELRSKLQQEVAENENLRKLLAKVLQEHRSPPRRDVTPRMASSAAPPPPATDDPSNPDRLLIASPKDGVVVSPMSDATPSRSPHGVTSAMIQFSTQVNETVHRYQGAMETTEILQSELRSLEEAATKVAGYEVPKETF